MRRKSVELLDKESAKGTMHGRVGRIGEARLKTGGERGVKKESQERSNTHLGVENGAR